MRPVNTSRCHSDCFAVYLSLLLSQAGSRQTTLLMWCRRYLTFFFQNFPQSLGEPDHQSATIDTPPSTLGNGVAYAWLNRARLVADSPPPFFFFCSSFFDVFSTFASPIV